MEVTEDGSVGGGGESRGFELFYNDEVDSDLRILNGISRYEHAPATKVTSFKWNHTLHVAGTIWMGSVVFEWVLLLRKNLN